MKGKKSFKIIVSLLLILLMCYLFYFVYNIYNERYTNNDSEEMMEEYSEIEAFVEENLAIEDVVCEDDCNNEIVEDDELFENDGQQVEEFGNGYIDDAIIEDDIFCLGNCEEFINESEVKYCKQVCGLIQVDLTVKETDCQTKEGLKKDYCLRDLAIKNSSFEDCEKIIDQKLQDQCVNRVREDFVDNL